MRRLQPVIWSKGTFLTPQHLQTQDLFVESNLQFRLDALNFRPWGFQELRISQEALAAGNLAISVASGIFADGLPFDIPASDLAPAPKALAPHFDAGQDSTDLFLAVPAYREGGLNVAGVQKGTDARYVAEEIKCKDQNTGMTEKSVLVARKNFRLLVTEELRKGTSALRIARVKRTPDGSFQHDAQFVPPLVSIAANEYLVDILRRLVEIMAAKSSALSGTRREKKKGLADFTVTDVADFWLLYTVNSYFPVLNHLFQTKKGHPEGMFSVMTSLAGALTTFSFEVQPRDLPTYDHDELGPCFTDLDVKLRTLLETVVRSRSVSLPMKLVAGSIYATAVADDKYLQNTRMYLAIAADTKVTDLIKKVPSLVKVSAGTRIDNLVRSALPGIKLVHTPTPPAGIRMKLDYEYFALNQSGEDWEAVGLARNLAAYAPADFPNPRMELVILLPQAD
jgi:type VI secretion system protein ImpJ